MYEQPVTRFLIVDKATKHSPEKVIKSLPNKCPKWWNQSRPDPIIEPMGHNQPAHERGINGLHTRRLKGNSGTIRKRMGRVLEEE
jgi:hypothetical protein